VGFKIEILAPGIAVIGVDFDKENARGGRHV